jgi:hypothetical protein
MLLRLDSFFIEGIEDRLVQNKAYLNGQNSQIKIKYNLNPIFVYPVTEDK